VDLSPESDWNRWGSVKHSAASDYMGTLTSHTLYIHSFALAMDPSDFSLWFSLARYCFSCIHCCNLIFGFPLQVSSLLSSDHKVGPTSIL
jgi:hypothetical protein